MVAGIAHAAVIRAGLLVALACCGAPLREPVSPAATAPAAPAAASSAAPAAHADAPAPTPDPDLHRPPPRRLLDIDWQAVSLTSDADALALWQRIAPTGADWDDKLQEVPAALAKPLAIALLHSGQLVCAKPRTDACALPVYDVNPPADTAGLDDPCLRRLLALWSIAQLDDADVAGAKDALLAVAAIPPPESELVAAAIRAVPTDDHDLHLALLATAWRAGQRELVDASIGGLDEAHLVEAVQRYHIAGALPVLSPESHRAVYLAAIADEALAPAARIAAITEIAALASDKLAGDARTALVAAAAAKDCSVAAAAVRVLDQHGEHRFLPSKPHTTNPGQLMRAACVLASYEALQHSDEPSLLASYLPPRGLERVIVSYDALSETDDDGDGDPHTTHTVELVPRSEAVLPDVEHITQAMQHCTGTTCLSDDYEVRFTWTKAGGEAWLSRLELIERPPCARP